jgi:molybdenum cofactor cytidylyltransferase
MPEPSSIAALILAAGGSSRMGAGRHKLLLPLGDRPVLAHTIEATLASQARPIVVVLGHQVAQVRDQISAHLDHPDVFSIENTDYLQGMSTSLRAGIQALINRENKAGSAAHSLAGVLIVLGDQPLMTARILDTLIASKHTTGKRILIPFYNGERGNPVLFDASLFPELLEITGDGGARSVIERHRSDIARIELGASMASYDVDTWDAYQEVVAEWERKHGERED